MQQSAPFFRMTGITKSYLMGGEWTPVLKGVSLSLEPGEFLSILGPSGSGKSTLMNLIGCLDTPTSGEYLLRGRRVDALSADELARIRNRDIGFVFQSFQLLPRLNALSNVELPLVYAGVAPAKRRERAEQMLERVGLADRMRYLPNQLSGGKQQRVAIARALVTNPAILLADEPTGALDQRTGGQVMDLFSRLHQEGRTLVMITHDPHIARRASRLMRLLDGELSEGAQEDA
ncbi:MAG TPA: ABC transporter ATP-binding protein [Candidatus Limiplasma stercoravium]|nr:ABC transporter ATP-binding protein [Candidatus Limiplasma stercoravium]